VASVLVAASIALYENEQVRIWVDNSRRKIAIALHSIGEEISPDSSSRSRQHQNPADDDDPAAEELRRRRRSEIIRQNRAELFRKASEEGVSVDLDELAAAGQDQYSEKYSEKERPGSVKSPSFDGLVGSDGRLRRERNSSDQGVASAVEKPEGLRQRGQGAHGFAGGAAFANPSSDEAHVLFDQAEQVDEKRAMEQPSRETTVTLQGDEDRATEASFHSAAHDFDVADMEDVRSNGTLTPTEGDFSASVSLAGSDYDSVSTSASVAGTNHDIGILSEVLSEAGLSDESFSEVGVSTPASWTDVDSDIDSDAGRGPHHQ
jgi:hypothetical protein